MDNARVSMNVTVGATLLAALMLTSVGAHLLYRQSASHVGRQSISAPARVEVVTTTTALERGLGGREVIPDDYGMLFVFDEADRYGFWMKDMLAPIDIIFLADDGTIVTLTENVTPETYPTAFYPDVPVRYVLEVRAGFARARGFAKDTRIEGLIPEGNP